jgi:hypothetical protein
MCIVWFILISEREGHTQLLFFPFAMSDLCSWLKCELVTELKIWNFNDIDYSKLNIFCTLGF